MKPQIQPPEEWGDDEWRATLASVISRTKFAEESIDDIISGCLHLGQRRAQLLNRSFSIGEDTVFALCLFCWWPFKPALQPDSRDFLYDARGPLFKSVARSKKALQELSDAVPDDLLRTDIQSIFDRLRVEHAARVITLRILAE